MSAADAAPGYPNSGYPAEPPSPPAPGDEYRAQASTTSGSSVNVVEITSQLPGMAAGGRAESDNGIAGGKKAEAQSVQLKADFSDDKLSSAPRKDNRLAQNAGQPQPGPAPATTPPTQPKQKDPKEPREQRADVEAAQPMLVYTAAMTMAVFEVKKSLSDVEALSRELGGFLARRTDAQITIRVPVSRFDEAIGRLEKMGDVVARNVTAEDVTEEFFDLDVRLKSARAVRDRLEQLLQKATKVEDSVLIERELTRVVGEIERIEGRMKFLRDRASYSTITVDFRDRGTEKVGNGPFNLPVPWLHELGLRRLLQL